MIALDPSPRGCRLRLRASPGASREGLSLREDGTLLVRVNAPAVEGAANEAITRFLAREVLGLPRGALRLVHGERGRDKVIEIEAPVEQVRASLEAALASRGSGKLQ